MSLLDVLESVAALPAEFWLVPPALILAAIFSITLMLRRALLNRYRTIAERTGLQLNARTIVYAPEVVGDYRGRKLVMTTVSPQRAQMTFRKTWTRVTVDVSNPMLIGLKLYRQDMLDTLLTPVGMPDLTIGDEAFDRRFMIRTDDAEMTRRLLQDRALRDDLIRADVDTVEMYGTKLVGYYARDERDVAHAAMLFDAMTHLADAIDALKRDDKREILSPGLN